MGIIKGRKFGYTLYLMRAIRNMERRAPRSPSKDCNIIGGTVSERVLRIFIDFPQQIYKLFDIVFGMLQFIALLWAKCSLLHK